jgi:hypothetical protein
MTTAVCVDVCSYVSIVQPISEGVKCIDLDIGNLDNTIIRLPECTGECSAKVAGVTLEDFGI